MHLKRFVPYLCFTAILALALAIRLSHADIAHFQLDQARSAQRAWDFARAGQLPAYDIPLSGGYTQFPLSVYIWSLAFLFSTSIHAIIIWSILLSASAIPLSWFFASRYWNWRVAAVASLLFAAAPWHAFFAHRLWGNVPMSPFVMLWLIAAALAYHERRSRYWALAWGSALMLFQLHPSGGIFILASGALFLGTPARARSWRWSSLGLALASIPALPWFGAYLSGAISFSPERMPLLGEGKRALSWSIRPLFDFLTTTEWRIWHSGEHIEELARAFMPLEALAIPSLLALGFSVAFAFWQAANRSCARRRLYRILCLWIGIPILLFPLVSFEAYSLVYYLPILPAPYLALAASWARLRPPWRKLCLVLIILVAILQARAVTESARFIRSGIARDDDTIWAVGGGAPLETQFRIAREAREAIARGDAAELILLIRPVLTLEFEHLVHALPLLADMPIRVLDQSQAHLLYPAKASLLLLDRHNTSLPAEYERAEEWALSGRYTLYKLPAAAGRAPAHPLPDRPGFANGAQLIGYDTLHCADGWRLHWTPGLATSDAATRTQLFVHLLAEDGTRLAQDDRGAFDARAWRSGDHIITTFEFGALSPSVIIDRALVGLYLFSLETQSYQEGIFALDEAGNPWRYGVELPIASGCEPSK